MDAETEMKRYCLWYPSSKDSSENSKVKTVLIWERKLGSTSKFDWNYLKMGYLERFCSDHSAASLAVGEGNIINSLDLFCMDRVMGWWAEALEKAASSWRNQTAGSATNQKILSTVNTKELWTALNNEMWGWGLSTQTSSLCLQQKGYLCALTLHETGVMRHTYFRQH